MPRQHAVRDPPPSSPPRSIVSTGQRCSSWAREAGVRPLGTAAHATGWLLVDWPLPWPKDPKHVEDWLRSARRCEVPASASSWWSRPKVTVVESSSTTTDLTTTAGSTAIVGERRSSEPLTSSMRALARHRPRRRCVDRGHRCPHLRPRHAGPALWIARHRARPHRRGGRRQRAPDEPPRWPPLRRDRAAAARSHVVGLPRARVARRPDDPVTSPRRAGREPARLDGAGRRRDAGRRRRGARRGRLGVARRTTPRPPGERRHRGHLRRGVSGPRQLAGHGREAPAPSCPGVRRTTREAPKAETEMEIVAIEPTAEALDR